MTSKKYRFAFALITTASLTSLALAAPAAPTTAPATTAPAAGGVIQVGDKAGLDANKDQDITVEGVVNDATWSNTGKVMNVNFVGADDTKFSAVVFAKNKQKIDEAFGGDATKQWAGAKVRIKGKLREFGGKSDAKKAHPEITISDPAQVTIVEPATSQPAK